MSKIYSQSDIELIIDNFDFDAVHKIFVERGYKYKGDVTPDVEELKSTARYVLSQVIVYDKDCCSTGRLCAYKFSWGLKLAFEPVSKTI